MRRWAKPLRGFTAIGARFFINSYVKLLIDGNLAFPPSEISCFRDITLYGIVFTRFEDILIEIDRQYKDQCWYWLKQNGAFDYIDDILDFNVERGVTISDRRRSNIRVSKIWAGNINLIVRSLKRY